MLRALLCLAMVSCPAAVWGAEFFVTPDGAQSGAGDRGHPWSLAFAFSHPAAATPGDTIWIRGGDYSLEQGLVSRLTGAEGRPILVRVPPGERARLDCAPATRRQSAVSCLEIHGAHVWYWGLEIWNSRLQRTAAEPGAAADPRGTGVHGRSGPGVRLIHLRIHDVGTALFESQPSGLQIYGLIAYHNGWDGPDRSHGPAVYIRNRATSPPKRIEDSVIFENFRQGLQGFGSIQNVFSNFVVEGNVLFNNGVGRDGFHRNLMFGNGSAEHVDNVFRSNITYFSSGAGAGENRFAEAGCRGLALIGNIFAHGPGRNALEVGPCSGLTLRGNVLLGRARVRGEPLCSAFADNRCFGSQRPSGLWAFLRPDRYEAGRALLTILNWDSAPTVAVALDGLSIPLGGSLAIRSVQDLDGRIERVRYQGGPLALSMAGWTPKRPVGLPDYEAPSALPELGVFELRWSAPIPLRSRRVNAR